MCLSRTRLWAHISVLWKKKREKKWTEWYPCIIPNFRENIFRFSPFTTLLIVVLLKIICHYVEVSSTIPNLFGVFIRKVYLILSKNFWHLFISINHVIFVPNIFLCCIMAIDLCTLSHHCTLQWNQVDHSIWYFNVLLNSFCKYFIENFPSMCIKEFGL
jgi:hypothetical protein